MDRVILTPPGNVDAALRIPGSKSITNRALIAAALAEGVTKFENLSLSDDSSLLINALRRLGVRVELQETVGEVHGRGGKLTAPDGAFRMGNAGTALRFVTSLLCLGHGEYVVTGDARMRERPIQGLVDALASLGADIECLNGCPPVTIRADGLRGGSASVQGGTSSQFLSSLLLSAPYAKEAVELAVQGELTSKPYVDMTIHVMKRFGVPVERDGYSKFSVKPVVYRPVTFEVDGDAAGSNYFLAVAAVSGGRVRIEGLGKESPQGEKDFVEVLARMGCEVEQTADYTEVRGGKLRGIDVDMNAIPDSVQTLAAVALFAEGPTNARNVPNLRVKETDRIAALAAELQKFGAKVEEREDGLTIHPPAQPAEAEVETYGDHRMAMSFAVVGAVRPVTIQDPAVVSKSFPDFFERLEGLGVGVKRA